MKLTAVGLSAVFFASGAMANPVACDVGAVLTDNSPDDSAIACAGIYTQTGQPTAAEIQAGIDAAVATTSITGPLVWNSLGKIDGGIGDSTLFEVRNSTDTGTGIGETSGIWSIGAASQMENAIYAIVMKGANDWGVWLPTTPAYNGTWHIETQISNPRGSNPAALSNFSIYYAMAPVPLPAAGWLLLAGVGGMVAMKRRSKKRAA